MSFLFVNKTLPLTNKETRTAMNAKISVFLICVETIIYLLLYNLHDGTFNLFYALLYFAKCEIFHKIFCGIFRKVDYIAYEHHWLFWNPLKTLPWVNLCKNNHYFDQKQSISITCQPCLSFIRGSKLIKMYR